MSKEKNYTNLVESYLDGELSSEEVLSFEKELAENKALKEELDFYQLAHAVVIDHKFLAIEQAISDAKSDFIKDRRRKKIQQAIVVSTAIVGLGLGLAGIYYFSQDEKQETNPKSQKESITVPVVVKEDTAQLSPIVTPKPTLEERKTVSTKTTETLKTKSSTLPTEKTEQTISQISNTEVQADQQKTASEKIFTEAVPKTKTSPCEGISIRVNTTVKPTCVGKETGEIALTGLKGGTTPYQFEISTGEKNNSGMFTELASANYTIKIIDKNFCETILDKLIVTEEFCKLDLFYDPSTGNEVHFPTYEKEGVLSIFDKAGNLKFTKTMHANDEFNWDATTNNSVLAAGYYIFIIKYENGKTQNGSVTVTP